MSRLLSLFGILALSACTSGVPSSSQAKAEVRSQVVTPHACGGLTPLTCAADEFCDYGLENVCGLSDRPGTCAPLPEVCPQVASPVCGCDGVTYSNACEANRNGVSVAAEGTCAAPGCEGANPQGCSVDADCGAGRHCADPSPIDGCIPSACACDVSTASWVCTADCAGSLCVDDEF